MALIKALSWRTESGATDIRGMIGVEMAVGADEVIVDDAIEGCDVFALVVPKKQSTVYQITTTTTTTCTRILTL